MRELHDILERLNEFFLIIYSAGWIIEKIEIKHTINKTLDSSNHVLLLKLSATLRFREKDSQKILEKVYDLKNKLLNAGFRVSIGGDYVERLEYMLNTLEDAVNKIKSILKNVEGDDRAYKTEVKTSNEFEKLKELTQIIWETSKELERLLERLEKGELRLDVDSHVPLSSPRE